MKEEKKKTDNNIKELFNEEMMQRHNNYIKDYILQVQENNLQYCLEKTIGCKNLDEYKELLKKEIGNIHKKNMKNLDDEINGG